MNKLVFLLEEPSLKEFLDNYLPRLLPGLDFLCVRHEGKQDLEKSIPRKLRAWQGATFVVVRDNDGAQCRDLKARLVGLCAQGKRPDTLVRLACQELESWYLGAPEALAEAYARPAISEVGRKAKFRNPDVLGSPSRELGRLIPEFRKLDGARRMGKAMPISPVANQSRSFQVFVAGVCRVAQAEARGNGYYQP
jgi:hypothetical protein